jgi:dienelactone hydrolase
MIDNRKIAKMLILYTLVMAFLAAIAFAAHAETIKIPWKGDYSFNTSKPWSRENPYDSGYSTLFNAGAPEEYDVIKEKGELNVEIMLPKDVKGPVPFIIVMHGCAGMFTAEKEWAQVVAAKFNPLGIGVLSLDSFTTRLVDSTCGKGDLHWGRRRAEDAYSALDYLIGRKLAKPSQVYLMGESNGGTTTLVAMSKVMSYHKNKFAAGFPVVPSCISVTLKYGDYYNPMIMFVAEKDGANLPEYCFEMMKKKRSRPLQMIVYKDVLHSYVLNQQVYFSRGHWIGYNERADKDTLDTVLAAIQTRNFGKGTEFR